MAKLPDSSALGERPAPTLPRRTPMVAQFRPTTGMEDDAAQQLAHSGAELQSAANVALQAKEHQDTLIAEDAYNRLQAKRMDLEFNPQSGFRNVQGMAAMGPKFFQDHVAKLSEATDQLSEGLDPSQKEKFMHRAGVAGLQYRGALLEHQSHQTNAFNDNTEANGVAIRLRNIGLNWGNDVAFATGLAEINGLLNARGMRKNLPPEQTEVEKGKALDEAWGTRIKAALLDDPLRADAMFKQHQLELGPQSRIILAHELKAAVMPVQAKSIAEQIVGGSVINPEQGGEPLMRVASTPESEAAGTPAPLNVRDTRASLAGWLSTAEKAADRVRPGDPVFRDMVVTQIKGYVNTIVAAQEGIAKQAHAALMTAAMGSSKGGKPITLDQLLRTPDARTAWSLTDPQSQRGLLALLEHNAKEARGEFVRSSPTVVQELFRRIHLPEGDPSKIRSKADLAPFFANGLNRTDHDWLGKEIDETQKPEGNVFLRDVQNLRSTAHRMIMGKDLSGGFFKDQFEEAAYRFNADLQQKIDKFRADGKDPRALLTPGSPDYVLTPERVSTFLPSRPAVVKERADKVKQGDQTLVTGTIKPAALPRVANDDDFAKLKSGDVFIDPNGEQRRKP